MLKLSTKSSHGEYSSGNLPRAILSYSKHEDEDEEEPDFFD
jgi:hypothetical protein